MYCYNCYFHQYIFRCTNCDNLGLVWQDLANNLNETEDEAIAIAKVDCSVEKDLCRGRGYFQVS